MEDSHMNYLVTESLVSLGAGYGMSMAEYDRNG
jgi:hypothetical protein